VVRDFRAALPDAAIYVYDNNSKDKTAERAREAGAIVRSETRQGKGNVVRRMFADIEADIYVLVDGDDTYDAFVRPRWCASWSKISTSCRAGASPRASRLSRRPCAGQPAADRPHRDDVPRQAAAIC
jgi:hypothetical protein